MNRVVYYDKSINLSTLKESGVTDVILSSTYFSRFGRLSKNDLREALEKLHDTDLKVVFEWDLLLTNDIFDQCRIEFESLDLSRVDYYRVLDPGVYSYLISKNKEIHLLLDSGPFHNLEAIKSFIELGEGLVKRIVISIELDQEELSRICDDLDLEIEYLGYGRILLFYTPRSLVVPLYDDSPEKEWIEVTANSEESPHKGFPVIENTHGTFMFNPKDHFVLEHMDSLVDLGVSHIRIDNRFIETQLTLNILESISNSSAASLKDQLPRKTIRGFFHKNKSDALFKKLKNHRILRHDKNYVGQVIEVERGECVGIYLRNSFSQGKKMQFTLITPEGKEKSVQVSDVKDASGKPFLEGKYGDIMFIPHVSGVSVKTNVYCEEL